MGALMFWLFAGITVLASLLVIGQRNPMYSVLLLIVSFGGLSGLYIMLDAPFVAAIQIIIYAGAIMVLFLFVVMLLNAPQEDAAEWDRTHPLRRPGFARVVLGVLLRRVQQHHHEQEEHHDRAGVDDDLNRGDERRVEQHIEAGQRTERGDQQEDAVNRIALRDHQQRRDDRDRGEHVERKRLNHRARREPF